MRLVAVGLSHHSAPVEVRERLAVSPGAIPALLAGLRERRLGDEAVLLSTCNRVELYTVPQSGATPEALAGFLAAQGGVVDVRDHLYTYTEQDALRHLFRVASSLDSMVLGEPQILGQVKQAYRLAAGSAAAGPLLHRMMDRALHVAKRVRTETGIGREAVSVGRAGVELARQVFGGLSDRSALLIGAGAHGKLVARSMLSHGLDELVVANRTFDRAARLAEMFGATATPLHEMHHYLDRVDVVVTSTGAGRTLLHRRDLQPIMRRRRWRPLVLIDLSVPRNIDPDVSDIEGVYCFDVDDLQEVAELGIEKRHRAARVAEAIVDEETQRAWRLLLGESVNAEIGALVRHADEIRRGELDRARAALGPLDASQEQVLDAMSRALVKKLLHRPLTHSRALAEAGQTPELARLLDALVPPPAPPNTESSDV
jgi:glutamyl-tRNA reductase